MFDLPQTPLPVYRIIQTAARLWSYSISQIILLTIIAVIIGITPSFIFPTLGSKDPRILLQYLANNLWILGIYIFFALIFITAIYYRLHMIIVGEKGGIFLALWISIRQLRKTIPGFFILSIPIIFGVFFGYIPGAIIALGASFYFPLIAIYDKGIFSAYKESFDLVFPYFWHAFLMYAVILSAYFVVVTFISLTALDVWKISHQNGEIWLSYGIFRAVINSIYYPFYASAILILLNDLKLRRHYDLEQEAVLSAE